MRLHGEYAGAMRDLKGDMIISFAIDDDRAIVDRLVDYGSEELDIDIDKHREKRSLTANAYFWKLCDQIAKKIGSDKDTIYKLQLSKYGVFVDISVIKDAVDVLKQHFRHVEEFDEGYGVEIARCYFGSSGYNSKEMSDLISGTCRDALDLGIDVWDQDQIDNLIREWKASK